MLQRRLPRKIVSTLPAPKSALSTKSTQGGCSRSLGLPRPALAKARLRFDDKPVGKFQSGGPTRFSSAGGADETLHLASCSRVRRGKLHMPQCNQRKPYIHRCGQRSTVRSKLGQPNVHHRGLAVSQAVVPGVGCGWIIGAVGPSNDREGDRRLNGSRKPTIGVDLGADGARTLMLVYNLPRTDAIYQQFNGIVGAAYFVAGLGVTALTSGDEGSCEIVRNPSLKRKPNVRRRLTALQGKVAAVEELQHRCYRLTDLRKF
jgi:hypothetical protein